MSREKKSKALNFRVAVTFWDRVQKLSADSGHEVSDICRFGLLACWPDIVELVMAAGNTALPESPETLEKLRTAVRQLGALAELGVDVNAALDRMLEEAGRPKLLPTGTQG